MDFNALVERIVSALEKQARAVEIIAENMGKHEIAATTSATTESATTGDGGLSRVEIMAELDKLGVAYNPSTGRDGLMRKLEKATKGTTKSVEKEPEAAVETPAVDPSAERLAQIARAEASADAPNTDVKETAKASAEDVRAALAVVTKSKLGREKAVEILGTFGVKKVIELNPAKFGEVVDACNKAIAEADADGL